MKTKITKLQDDDGHWYWIPDDKLESFKAQLSEIEGKYYMDDPDKFDRFNDEFEVYRTGGDPDLIPEIFKNNQ